LLPTPVFPDAPDANLFAMYEEVGIGREEFLDRAAGIGLGSLNPTQLNSA
jgi:hypothetical protein